MSDLNLADVSPAVFQAQLETLFSVDLSCFGMEADGTVQRRTDVYPDGAELALRLVEVKTWDRLSEHLRAEPFSLLFCGTHDVPLFQGTHLLNHPELGSMTVMLTPVTAEIGIHPEHHPDGRFYEIIFN